ncbi:MAG: hypothetical protein IKZ96_04345 [Bacilli bacterium]|nr:hypothetical protein [Bacilli bacterium]
MSKELDRISEKLTKIENRITIKTAIFNAVHYQVVKDYPQYFFGPKTLKPGKSKKVKKQ